MINWNYTVYTVLTTWSLLSIMLIMINDVNIESIFFFTGLRATMFRLSRLSQAVGLLIAGTVTSLKSHWDPRRNLERGGVSL